MNPSLSEPSVTERAAPVRQLSLVDSTSIIVGIIIGSGIYETTQSVARCVAGPYSLIAVWVLGALFALVGSLCYAELATAYPAEGGDYVYLTRAYGRSVGFLFAWTQLWVVRPGTIGTMALVFAHYASEWVPTAAIPDLLLAAGAVVVLTTVNILGVRQGKWTQNVLTSAKILGLLGVLAAGLLADPLALPVAADKPLDTSVNFTLAMIFVLYAYSGWNEMAYVAAEIRQPERNVLRALLAGTFAVAAIYLALNCAFLKVLGYQGLAYGKAAAADVVRPLLGDAGSAAISLLVCISALGAMNGMTFTGSRIYYALGQQHALFAALGRWSPRFGTPVRSLVLEAGITLVSLAVLQWVYHGEGKPFERLVNFTAPLFWLFLALATAALIVLRFREPGRPRPFRVPLYPLLPILFVGACGFMFYSAVAYALSQRSWEALWLLAVLASGALLAWFERKPRRPI